MSLQHRAIPAMARTLKPWARRSHLSSTVLALAGFLASMSPSLLPRTWYIQGTIAGVCAAGGYAFGRFLEWVAMGVGRWARVEVTMAPTARRLLVWGWPLVVILVTALTPVFFLRRHRRTAELFGLPAPAKLDLVYATGLAIVVFLLLLALWHGLTALVGWTSGMLNRALPRWAAGGLAGLLVLVLLGLGIDRFVIDPFINRAMRAAATVNAGALSDPPPASALRSGSDESAESWETLGFEGRTFVASGPAQVEIAEVTGEPAMEPIRVYAGLTGERDIAQTAAAVVDELERTGAFEREAILVVTSTGTGWVNEWVPSAFEFLLGGDSAVAAMQYSNLPSVLALAQGATAPPEAANGLISAVEARLAELPEEDRPRLLVSGESLGAYGANAVFSSLEDMLSRIDGAVFTGTPAFTRLHQEITESRVLSSTQVLPVVDDGRHVRFASTQDQLEADQFGRALGQWDHPRVVYLQHPSDPVVWWSPRLLYRTPDWLDETRRGTTTEQMSWTPFVTFWQVTADLPWADRGPHSQGHRYMQEVVPAMAAVLGDDPSDRYAAIQEAIAAKDRFILEEARQADAAP